MHGWARVGHPIHNCCLCLFFLEKDCIYLDAERLYDHNKQEMLTSPPRESSEQGKDTVLVAHVLQIHAQKWRHAL